jgi:O-antigen ligase
VGVVFLATRPDAAKRLAGGLTALAVLFALMYVSPLKESVLDRLPFIGTADQETVEYRRVLAEVSWTLIQQNPFFGDPFVASRMESLRNGQGIIDIVNGYIYTALFNGLVGLALLVGFSLLALFRGFAAFRQSNDDRDARTLGAALLASMVAALVYVATAGYNETLYMLFGLSVSYAFCCQGRVPAAHITRVVDQRRAMSSRTL